MTKPQQKRAWIVIIIIIGLFIAMGMYNDSHSMSAEDERKAELIRHALERLQFDPQQQ